ncbi:MAG: ComEC family competence protein [Chloroflexia bacterium]|nr:ComEC family competence protein [Chloroflexia bacterium]
MTLVHVALAWLVGIALGTWLRAGWPVVGLLAGLLSLLGVLWHRRPASRRPLLLAFVVVLGLARWCLAQPRWGPDEAAFYAGQPVELQGTVAGEVERDAYGASFPLRAEALRRPGEGWRPVGGLVLIQGDRTLAADYGERLLLEGTLERPAGGSSFYRQHLARQGMHVLLGPVERLERMDGLGGSRLRRGLARVRDWARRRLERLLPEPQASLLVGILLGTRTSMPAEVQQAFSRSGTTHILAISGWNISIVAAFFAAVGRRLPRRASFALVLAGIALYTMFVGGGAAVLRAALMGLLYVLAQQVGRPSHGITALLASAWALTLWNPGLLWDIGFQLSFMATLGMLLFVPVWTQSLARWPGFLAESLAATLASQVLTWPIIALYFRQFSLIVPLSNLLACPTLAPLMLSGTLTLLLGGLPLLGFLLRGITWLLATYMLRVVRWSGELAWASVGMPRLGVVFLALYYGGLGLWMWHERRLGDFERANV